MRESYSHEPINPEDIRESNENKVWEFKNEDIDVRLPEEIMIYFDKSKESFKDLESLDLAFAIDSLLVTSDLIEVFEHQNLGVISSFVEITYEPIKEALDANLILKNAPWFTLLNDKMIAASIYIAGLTTDESLKKGRDSHSVYYDVEE